MNTFEPQIIAFCCHYCAYAAAEVIRKKSIILKNYCDAVNITDNQTAIVRMSSIASAVIVKETGLKPIIQIVCRDRNRIAIQSDVLGAAANPFADPLELRIVRLAKKISTGADFIQTQPVIDLKRFNDWMEMVRQKGLHKMTSILAGVMPVKSAKALLYMRNNVPGIRIPDELISRLEKASNPKTKYSPDNILRYEGEDFVEKSAGIEEILSAVERYLP